MDKNTNNNKRKFLSNVVATFTFVGIGFSFTPFIKSCFPRKERIHDFDVFVDISKLDFENPIEVTWKGIPILVFKRNAEELKIIRTLDITDLRDPYSKLSQTNTEIDQTYRSIRSDIMVVSLVCKHLGCKVNRIPKGSKDFFDNWEGGFYCRCHGSKYDLSGRVFMNESPSNLDIPPYKFVDEKTIIIGRV